jgi:hypothetical protein
VKLPIVEPGKKPRLPALSSVAPLGQGERLREVGHDGLHRQVREVAREAGGRVVQEVGGDVDRHVALQRMHRREQQARLAARAAADLDEAVHAADLALELGREAGQQARLGARRVVLGDLGDLLEQLGAAAVVQPDAGDVLLVVVEAFEHVGLELRIDAERRRERRDVVARGQLGRMRGWASPTGCLVSCVLREAQAAELPALPGLKEIAIAGAQVAARRRARAAAQHVLAVHELAVVFADRARRGAEAGIGHVGAGRPFPHVAEHLLQARRRPSAAARPPRALLDEVAFDRQPRAANSHSNSVGSRLPAQRA